MAISYFTHLCAFLRRFNPYTFKQVSLLNVCGQSVYVSKFPPFALGVSDAPGWYFVDSVIYYHSGQVDLGLEITPGNIEFYPFSDIEIDVIGSARSEEERDKRPTSEHGTDHDNNCY